MLHAQQGAKDVGVEGGRVALGGLLCHRTGLAFGAGVIDGHIQATEARDGLIDQVSYVVLVAYIGMHVFCLHIKSAEFSHQILAGFVASTRDNDAHPLFGEGQGGGSSNACEGASDQNNGSSHRVLLGGQFMGQLRSTGRIWTYVLYVKGFTVGPIIPPPQPRSFGVYLNVRTHLWLSFPVTTSFCCKRILGVVLTCRPPVIPRAREKFTLLLAPTRGQ